MKHLHRLIVTSIFTLALLVPLVLQVSAQADVDDDWWDQSWNYRIPYRLYSGEYRRTDVPVELMINFTSWLDEFGVQGTFDENSTRVVEYNTLTGEVWETPSQFDRDLNYDSRSNATGIISWIVNGTTPANTTREYYVYFDILENGPKEAPEYSGVLYRISGDYVFLENQKVNLSIRYGNKIGVEGVYFDRNNNRVFEPGEEMIGEDSPYSVAVRVTDAENEEHGWASPFFESSLSGQSTLTFLRDGPVVKQIELSGISLKNNAGEVCNITANLMLKIYNASTTVYLKSILTVNEDLEVAYAYEYDFLNHVNLYDRWYISENDYGKFTYELDSKSLYLDVPPSGFVSSYNSLGNGGVAFIPKVSCYSKVQLLEYSERGPSIRLYLTPGLWEAGAKMILENNLLVHLGDWSKAKEETLNLGYPPVFIGTLQVHCVDNNKIDVAEAEVRIYNLFGTETRMGITDSTGWVTFERVGFGTYVINAFFLGQQVGNKTIHFLRDFTVDPLECYFFNLTIHVFNVEKGPMAGVSVRTYRPDGMRISSNETNPSGYVFFSQLPTGVYVIKTYYEEQQFADESSIHLDKDTELTIFETPRLTPNQIVRRDIVYVFLVAGLAITVTIIVRKKGSEKTKFGLLLFTLILLVLLAGTCVQSSSHLLNSSAYGVSASYNRDTGFVTVGDVVFVRWKDTDQDGSLDDWNLFVLTSNLTELVRIDFRTSLVTPVGVYALYEAQTRCVFYFNEATENYMLYKPLVQEPDFVKNAFYAQNVRLQFVFDNPNQWNLTVSCHIEKGKPSIQLSWEINENGAGTGNYIVYPQIIPVVPLNRLVLPADYASNDLRYWNQKDGPSHGNPWTAETDFSTFSGHIGTMYVSDENLYLHSNVDYESQVNVHASSAFSRSTNWVHVMDASPSAYFQYDFWIDWDGEDAPSSDVEIEFWVPDALDLNSTEVSFSSDGSSWQRFVGYTLFEGDVGDPSFTTYYGCRHRLKVVFADWLFTSDDGDDTGTDYGHPFRENDEYLIRVKIAYLNQGLATYEYEYGPNVWYGLQNMNDAWIWLLSSEEESWSVGIVPSERLDYFSCESEDTELYRTVTLGVSESLGNNSRECFFTNIVFFTIDQVARQDLDSDGVLNMFDEELPEHLPHSALFMSKESLGEITYNRLESNENLRCYHWIFEKKPLINDWNVDPEFMICLPKEIGGHLEIDDAIFRFERCGYYVYDVGQSNEVRWKERATDSLITYQLFAAGGVAAIGLVQLLTWRDTVRKYRLILILFIVGLSVRLFFQNFSPDFVGSDAALYGNVAENLLSYGKLQRNFLSVEPHYARVGNLPEEVTTPYHHSVDRLLYPLQIVLAFTIFDQSFMAIKFVDVICGSLVILPTFYLARKLFDEKTAIVATLLVIFHPLLIYYSGVHPSTNILPALFGTVALSALLYQSRKAGFIAGVSSILLLLARFEYGLILMTTILVYHIIAFKKDFWKVKNLQIVTSIFLVTLFGLVVWSYFAYGRLVMFSTRVLGGGLGEFPAPTLLETLTNPTFTQVRLYNALYGWWHAVYQDNPFIFLTAMLGLLVNIRNWRKLSSVYLFPCFAILFYSLSIRTQPQSRFIVQYLPSFAVLSAAFFVKVANSISGTKSRHIKALRKVRLKYTLLLIILTEITLLSFFPRYILIHTAMDNWTWRFNGGEVYRWIDVNTPPEAIIMAYSPVYTFYTERETVGIPTPLGTSRVDLYMIISIIKRYKVDFLVLDYTSYAVEDLRQLLMNPLNSPDGFGLVYWTEDPTAFNRRLLIYDVRALRYAPAEV